jgi:hypothetical protein
VTLLSPSRLRQFLSPCLRLIPYREQLSAPNMWKGHLLCGL